MDADLPSVIAGLKGQKTADADLDFVAADFGVVADLDGRVNPTTLTDLDRIRIERFEAIQIRQRGRIHPHRA